MKAVVFDFAESRGDPSTRLSIRLVFVRRGDEAAESFRRATTQEK